MDRATLKHLEETFQISPNSNHQQATARKKAIEKAVRTILKNIGEDPHRQGLQRTPERIARMYDEFTAGYHVDPAELINDALFEGDYREITCCPFLAKPTWPIFPRTK